MNAFLIYSNLPFTLMFRVEYFSRRKSGSGPHITASPCFTFTQNSSVQFPWSASLAKQACSPLADDLLWVCGFFYNRMEPREHVVRASASWVLHKRLTSVQGPTGTELQCDAEQTRSHQTQLFGFNARGEFFKHFWYFDTLAVFLTNLSQSSLTRC